MLFLFINMKNLTGVFLHRDERLCNKSFRVSGHVAESAKPLQIFGVLFAKILEVLVSRFVVRINHSNPTSVDQLWRQRFHLSRKKSRIYFKKYT